MIRSGVVRCMLAALLFGASAPAVSTLSGSMPVLVLAGLLYVGAAIAVLPATLQQSRAGQTPIRRALEQEWKPLAVAVVAGGAIGPALLVAGLARTNAATASILLNLELVATVILAGTIFREHLGRRVIVGAALVGLGGVVLVWQPGAEVSIGALLIAAGCVAWGFDNGVTANIQQLSPEQVVLVKGVVAGVANLGLGLILAGGLGSGTGFEALGRVAVTLVIGALGYGLSITLWVKGARDLGAARGQVIFATAPFIGALIAWSVLREPATWPQFLAAGLALLGVGVSLDSAHEHGHVHHPVEHDHEHTHDDGHHDSAHHDDPHHDVGHHNAGHPAGEPGRPLVGAGERHSHPHRHHPRRHSHAHLPDLHHRHEHD